MKKATLFKAVDRKWNEVVKQIWIQNENSVDVSKFAIDFSSAVLEMINNTKLRDTLSRTALDRAKDFSTDIFKEKIIHYAGGAFPS